MLRLWVEPTRTAFNVEGPREGQEGGTVRRLARLWLLGALVAALVVLAGPGVASAGPIGSAGALAEDALSQEGPQSSGSDDGGDDGDDDDGGGGGGGQDRAFCAPAGPPERGQCTYTAFPASHFDFDATSGPLGENPTGSADFFHTFDITCLQVTGNRAAFGGPITFSPIFAVGEWLAFTVVDNGPAPDLASGGFWLPTPPPPNTPDCGDINEPVHAVTGDIVVQDNIGAGGGGGGDDDDDGDDD
jgi:hypothetical protein